MSLDKVKQRILHYYGKYAYDKVKHTFRVSEWMILQIYLDLESRFFIHGVRVSKVFTDLDSSSTKI